MNTVSGNKDKNEEGIKNKSWGLLRVRNYLNSWPEFNAGEHLEGEAVKVICEVEQEVEDVKR